MTSKLDPAAPGRTGAAANIQAAPESSLRAQELAGQRLLAGVDPAAVLRLFRRCPARLLGAGEVLIDPNSTEPVAYLILEGALDILLDPNDTSAVATLRAGDGVGELALIDGRPRSATVVAQEASRVLEVNAETFSALIRTS